MLEIQNYTTSNNHQITLAGIPLLNTFMQHSKARQGDSCISWKALIALIREPNGPLLFYMSP